MGAATFLLQKPLPWGVTIFRSFRLQDLAEGERWAAPEAGPPVRRWYPGSGLDPVFNQTARIIFAERLVVFFKGRWAQGFCSSRPAAAQWFSA